MPDDGAETIGRRTVLDEPSSVFGEILRYGLSMAVVVAVVAGLVVSIGRVVPDQEAADPDNAVLVDLMPAEASSQPSSDAADGPEQQAAPAAPAQQAPDVVEPPNPLDPPKPLEPPPPEPAAADKPVEEPPPVVEPDPPAVLERAQPPAPPPKPVAVPATQAQDEHAPAGSPTPAKTDADDGDEGRPPPSAQAITLWQKSLMKRLEAAKHQVGREPHAAGTVKVAFEIDAGGGLASERVAQSSGSTTLDKAALLLVRRAAPFPAPPGRAASRDTSFVIPVRFR